MLYQPQNNVDGEDSGDSSKGQALQDAAAGVRAITSLCCAVLLHQWAQETPDIQLFQRTTTTCRPGLKRRLSRTQQVRAHRHGSGAGLKKPFKLSKHHWGEMTGNKKYQWDIFVKIFQLDEMSIWKNISALPLQKCYILKCINIENSWDGISENKILKVIFLELLKKTLVGFLKIFKFHADNDGDDRIWSSLPGLSSWSIVH